MRQRRGARILAVLRGWAMTNDASHPTAPHKDGAGLASCIRRALEMAECGIDEVGYVNAHGTGTPLNDIAETHAYESAFHGRSRPIPVSSTKSYFGHCLGAAGALEAAITITAHPGRRALSHPAADRSHREQRDRLAAWRTAPPAVAGGNVGFRGIWRQQRRAGLWESPRMNTTWPALTGIGSVTPYGPLAGLVPAEPRWSPDVITAWTTPGLRRAFLVEPFHPAGIVPGLKTRRLDRLSAWALVASSLALQDAGSIWPDRSLPHCRFLRYWLWLRRTHRGFLSKRGHKWLGGDRPHYLSRDARQCSGRSCGALSSICAGPT